MFEVYIPFREPVEDLLKCDTSLQAGERGAQAEMRTDAECQMLTRWAVNIENVAVRRELAVIAACRTDQHHHDAALGHRLAVVLDIASQVPRHVRGRWLLTQ